MGPGDERLNILFYHVLIHHVCMLRSATCDNKQQALSHAQLDFGGFRQHVACSVLQCAERLSRLASPRPCFSEGIVLLFYM